MYTFSGVSASPGLVLGPVEMIDHGTTGLHRIVCDPFRERALYDVAVVLAIDIEDLTRYKIERASCWERVLRLE